MPRAIPAATSPQEFPPENLIHTQMIGGRVARADYQPGQRARFFPPASAWRRTRGGGGVVDGGAVSVAAGLTSTSLICSRLRAAATAASVRILALRSHKR
jgi:hypothetical protein